MPSLPVLVATTVLVGAGFSVLAQRRRHFGQILAAALAAQAAFHVAFSLESPHTPAAHFGHGMSMGNQTAHLLPHAWQSAQTVVVGLAMVAGHLAAAAVMAWLAAYGEATVWRLLGLFTLVRLPRPAPVAVDRRAVLVPSKAWHRPAGDPWSARVRPLRGPPATCLG